MKLLKPCPFCGGIAYVMRLKQSVSPRYFVACGNSAERYIAAEHWVFGRFFSTQEEAVEAWNRRTDND